MYVFSCHITLKECTEPETRDLRLQELRQFLLNGEYRPGMVDSAIARARAIPRAKALRYVVTHKQTRRPVCVVTHDPRLPDIKTIQLKHWRRMKYAYPYLEEVFPEPPLVAFKQQKNFKNYVIRAKVPPPTNLRPKE